MRRWFFFAFVPIVMADVSLGAQVNPSAPKLGAIPGQIEANPEDPAKLLAMEVDSIVQSASLAEIQQVVPAFVKLTESPNEHLRGSALLMLSAIAGKTKVGPENRSEIDITGAQAIVPYITRLEPRLMDSAPPCRALAFLVLGSLSVIRPTPPELIQAALTVLKSPQSTRLMPNANGPSSSLGPHMLWILLPAAADFYRDPVTNITVGRDSPEVQEAIIQFLHRSDQTIESLSESLRALTLAQAQNPAVNASLVPLLSSPDVSVQEALLRTLPALALSTEDFAAARARVTSMASDTNTPEEVRQIANSVLPHWSNERHQSVRPPL